MKQGKVARKLKIYSLALAFSILLPLTAYATNGDNLIGVGPISRSMGGVGIAAPLDAISSTFSNPAAMCVGPFCPNSEFDFSATLFAPKVDGKITIGDTSIKSRADEKVYMVPAFGISTPINHKLRLGLSAYGVTGLGVDHRDTDLSGLLAADSTQLMILKFAPTIAFQYSEDLSVGAALHIVNSQLDLNQGTSAGYGVGGQIGVLYKVSDTVTLGATYQSPIKADHQNVYNLDEMTTGSPTQDSFALESSHTLGLGIAYKQNSRFLLEFDVKWLNWSEAEGYDVLDWDDQVVLAAGAQYKPTADLVLRVGYNYGENPIKGRSFDGDGIVKVQGKDVNAYGFETLRVIGFPAIVEHHITAGIGYDINSAVSLNFGYMHAFKETITSRGTLPTPFGGSPVELESELSEDAVDFSLAWRF